MFAPVSIVSDRTGTVVSSITAYPTSSTNHRAAFRSVTRTAGFHQFLKPFIEHSYNWKCIVGAQPTVLARRE
jgi:hypothetical protein